MANPFLQALLGGQLGPTRPPWMTPGINPGAPMPPVPWRPTMPNAGAGGGLAVPMSAPPVPPPAPPRGPAWLQKAAGGFDKVLQGLQSPIASSLMQAAAPQPAGTMSPFAGIGAAMQNAQQMQTQIDENALRKKLIEAQIAQMQAPQEERADPAALREMQALGYPMTPEGFEMYNKAKGSENAAADQLALLQGRLAMEQRADQIERDRRTDTQAQEERTRRRQSLGNTINRGIKQTEKIVDLTNQLEGSFIAAGLPAASWRRTAAGALSGVGSAIGMDTAKLEKDLANFDTLKKNMSDQLINLMSTGGLGEATNSKLEQYQSALASTETAPGAVLAIQANILETLLQEADVQGIEVADRDKWEANIDRWRGHAAEEAGGMSGMPDMTTLSDEELRRLASGGK